MDRVSSKAPWRRFFLPVILSMQILLEMPGSAHLSPNREPRFPLLIIAEPAAEGNSGSAGGDLADAIAWLGEAGYVVNEDLFTSHPPVFSDILPGEEAIARDINAVSHSSRTGVVDVIACGISGLLARLALERGLVEDGTVRNLIMVSAPNRGTFLANFMKSILEIVRHESLLEEETRAWRYLPLPPEPKSSLSKSKVQEKPEEIGMGLPEGAWETETAWVANRVRAVYEPLYARYVEERYYALPYVPTESPKETFAGWVKRNAPKLWDESIRGGSLPPVQDVPLDISSSPPPGGGLSRAYYEILSMEVAKNQYAMSLASKNSLIGTVLAKPYVPKDWRDALVYYGGRVLAYYAEKALVTVKAKVQEFLADRVLAFTGMADDLDSPMLDRLIKEDMLVNLGTSAGERFERLAANCYLATLNQRSKERSTERATRYVSIASSLANPWKLLWPQLGPNDFLTEVDSTIAPDGPRDRVAVFHGLWSPSGQDLLCDKKVQAYLIPLLEGNGGKPELPSISGVNPTGEVSSWDPVYIKPSEPGGGSENPEGSRAKEVSFTLPSPPDGWQYAAWHDDAEAAGVTTLESAQANNSVPCHTGFFSSGGTYSAQIPEGKVLGLRLMRSAPVNPVEGGTVGSAYASKVRVAVSLLENGQMGDPVAGGQEGGSAGSSESGTAGGSSGEGTVGNGSGTGSAPGTPAGGSHEGDPSSPDTSPVQPSDPSDGDAPLVRVVYRNKHTSLKEPSETYHDHWVMDFGDGSLPLTDGSSRLSVSHVYPGPGTYSAEAVSYSNSGAVLLSRHWDVEVTGPRDSTVQFSCVSLTRVRAVMSVSGPKMWVTGKPARFQGDLKVETPPEVEVVSLRYDPGRVFDVLWERAGDFNVSCAATVKLRYFLEGEETMVENTYVTEVPVTVLTTGVVR